MIASKDLPSKNRSGDTIGRLAWDFLSANEHEQFIGVRHFLEHTTRVLNQQASCVPLTNDLLAILVHELHLWVEGNTDALTRSALFSEWHSFRLEDAWFGAKDVSQLVLAGRNTYLNLFNSPSEHIERFLTSVFNGLESSDPTRVVMVGKATIFDKFRQDRRILEVASLDDYFGFKISIILAINKSSMVVDPISWSSL